MTDIERLRENVINAAREAARNEWQGRSALHPLLEAVDALDAALTPCPWKLLEDISNRLDTGTGKYRDDFHPMNGPVRDRELANRIVAALEWRQANP